MVKFYSNENFPMDVVMELRRLGYDVLTSYDAGQANQGIPDEDVLTFATQQERAVITLNRDSVMFTTHRGGSAIAFLNLPNWWLAGGAVRNTVWRL